MGERKMLDIMDLGYNLINVDKHIRLFLKKELKKHCLSATEGLVLLLLLRQEHQIETGKRRETVGLTQERIMQDLHYDKGVMTRVMQSLERQGYVARRANPEDGRSYLFSLNDKAFFIKEELIAILQCWQKEVFGGFSEEDIATLTKLAQRISDNSWDFYNRLS